MRRKADGVDGLLIQSCNGQLPRHSRAERFAALGARARVRPARDRRRHHRVRHRARRRAARARRRARREGRFRERHVEPLVAPHPRRRALSRARAPAPGVRVERRAAAAAPPRAAPRAAARVHVARVRRRANSALEARRRADAVRRAGAVPQRRPAPAAERARRARARAGAARATACAAARSTSTPRPTTRASRWPTRSARREAGAVVVNHADARDLLPRRRRVVGARGRTTRSPGARSTCARRRRERDRTVERHRPPARSADAAPAVRGSKGAHIAVPRDRVGNHGALTLLSPMRRPRDVRAARRARTRSSARPTRSRPRRRTTCARRPTTCAYLLDAANRSSPRATLTTGRRRQRVGGHSSAAPDARRHARRGVARARGRRRAARVSSRSPAGSSRRIASWPPTSLDVVVARSDVRSRDETARRRCPAATSGRSTRSWPRSSRRTNDAPLAAHLADRTVAAGGWSGARSRGRRRRASSTRPAVHRRRASILRAERDGLHARRSPHPPNQARVRDSRPRHVDRPTRRGGRGGRVELGRARERRFRGRLRQPKCNESFQSTPEDGGFRARRRATIAR